MNLSAFHPRNCAVGHGSALFKNVSPVAQEVAKAIQAAPVKPVALGAEAKMASAATSGDLVAVLKTMTAGIEAMAAAIRAPVQKSVPQRAVDPTPARTSVADNTPMASAAKRVRVAEITGQVQRAPNRATPALSVSGNAPSVAIVTEGQRRRSTDDAVAAQRAADRVAADRVLVLKGGARTLTLRQLDASLSENALIALSHILSKWEEAQKRPVRVRAADLGAVTGLSTAEAQAALIELEAKHATVVSINSVGTKLILPSYAVTGA